MSTLPARRRYTLLGLACLLAVLAAIFWYFKRPASVAPATVAPAVRVTTATVLSQSVPIYKAGVGTVIAAQSVTVKARIDGQLDQVGFTEGQDVKAGQMLARIDPRALQAQLAQVQAQRARDQAQLLNARSDLKRYARLIGEDAATQQQLDTQKALVAQLEAAIQTDEAQIRYAQVQLSFTTINAPISGRVGARLVDPGNIVHAADANGLVVINQIDPIAVVFTLPGDAVQEINQAQRTSHQPLAVQAYAREGQQLLGTGQLVLVNNQIDTSSGTVQLKARFANPAHRLWPGQYVNMRLMLGERANAVTVPAAVVQRSQNDTYAYVVQDDGTARLQPIKVATIQDGTAIIDSGLAAGQQVVLDGQYKVKSGTKVTGTAPAAAPGASAAASGAGAGAGR